MKNVICPVITKAEFAYSRVFDKSADFREPGYNITFPNGAVEWVSKDTFERYFYEIKTT